MVPDRESFSYFFHKSLASPVHYGITSSKIHIDKSSSSHLYIAPFIATFHESPPSFYKYLVPISEKQIFLATINDSVSPSYTFQLEPFLPQNQISSRHNPVVFLEVKHFSAIQWDKSLGGPPNFLAFSNTS